MRSASTPRKQNIQTVGLHVLLTFVSAFSATLTASKLGTDMSTWAAVLTSAATAGFGSVVAYLSGVLNMVAPADAPTSSSKS